MKKQKEKTEFSLVNNQKHILLICPNADRVVQALLNYPIRFIPFYIKDRNYGSTYEYSFVNQLNICMQLTIIDSSDKFLNTAK